MRTRVTVDNTVRTPTRRATGSAKAEHTRALSWFVLPVALAVVVFNESVQRWLDFQPPSFPGDSFASPLLGIVLLLAAGPLLWGSIKDARAVRPGPLLVSSFSVTVGVFALVTATFSGCGC